MRRVNYTDTGKIQDQAARAAILAIIRASAEVDLTDIANAFTVSGSYTRTTTLNVTTPTLANAVAFLATFIDDCKRGGANRST
jgi:hypothetical protein